jgi:hypothetical protein
MRMSDPTITWELPMSQANVVLGVLGKQPFEQVADLIVLLRQQAGEQIQRLQAPPGLSNGNGEARQDHVGEAGNA